MVSCSSCGKELNTVSSFCPWCGSPLIQTPSATPIPSSQPQASPPKPWTDPFYTSPYRPHSHRGYHMAIGILSISLIVLSVITVPLAFQRSLSSFLPLNTSPVKERRISQYWSGYTTEYSRGSVVDVRASWVIPVLNCAGTSDELRATTLLSIGRSAENSSPQPSVGVDYVCRSNTPEYIVTYGWNFAIRYSVLDVQAKPGDTVSAEIRWEQGKFIDTIEDSAQGWLVEKENSTFQSTPLRATAEWLVTSVEIGSEPAPLANFGSVRFFNCYATISGITGPVGSFSLVQYTMISASGVATAGPQVLPSRDGSNFSIQWLA
ncbi:zinc-ribbon domain-containing protein [Candidatus Bathyarchaeota archaeon]|nr:MAG: zinc-ribbon domain-containing protein [Candidatus Bathyarchaeota archaeon]TMI31618.1 MAG: zinc-ribbon domain-containing protein [Candidatus Bathyarchaeota archaeon]